MRRRSRATGSFVAFLSDRDGPTDVWVTQVGTGQFHNLTRRCVPRAGEPVPPHARVLPGLRRWSTCGFAGRTCRSGASACGRCRRWGARRALYLEDVGRAGLVARRQPARLPHAGGWRSALREGHATVPASQVFAAPPGQHGHFPLWSPDDRFIYFVQGTLPDEMDVWRLAPGGAPERLTSHNARVSHPTFRGRPDPPLPGHGTDDGSGPWLYAMDLRRRVPRRVSFGVETYTSLAASRDGSRLVATVANREGYAVAGSARRCGPGARPHLAGSRCRPWAAALRASPPTRSCTCPPRAAAKASGGSPADRPPSSGARRARACSAAPRCHRMAGASPSPSRSAGARRLLAMDADGTNVRVLDESLDLRGAPTWAPDGQSLVVAAIRDGVPRLLQGSHSGRPAHGADRRSTRWIRPGRPTAACWPTRARTWGRRSRSRP